MKIYLMRHGETEYNRQHFFYGITDVSINETGHQQAAELQKKLAFLPQSLPVYTSQLKRTRETAAIIFPQQVIQSVACLNEKSFGLWEGLTANQIEAQYPTEWQHWLDAPFDYTPPEADEFHKFEKKVLAGWQELTETDQDFAVVAHLGVLRVILHQLFPEKNFWDIQLDQGNYTELECLNKKIHIKKWNQ